MVQSSCPNWSITYTLQVAYLMADISNVQASEIKEISDALEGLSCECIPSDCEHTRLTRYSSNPNTYSLLKKGLGERIKSIMGMGRAFNWKVKDGVLGV